MKLLLVQAYSRFLKQVYPPVGLGIISSIAKKCGWSTEIIDAQLTRATPMKVLNRILKEEKSGKEPFTAVGISGTIPTAPYIESLSRILRQKKPDLKQILGGPYVSSLGLESLSRTRADIAVPGEAEYKLPEILSALENDSGCNKIPGVYSVDQNKREFIKSRQTVSWKDIPITDWKGLQLKKYWLSSNRPMSCRDPRYMIMFTSRGCPFDCSYCHHNFGQSFRARNIESILEEIGMMKKDFGVKEIHIHDDAFNANENHAISVLQAINKYHPELTLSFPNGFRLDCLSDELFKELKLCGVKQINIGVETGVRKIREKTLKWNLSNSEIMHNCIRIKKAGFRLHSQFMIGFPGETKKEMIRTIRFACELPLDTANFSAVCPYPGTRLNKELKDSGMKLSEDYGKYLFQSRKSVNISDLDDYSFQKIRTRAVREFYFRPHILYNAINDPITWTSFRGRVRWFTERFFPGGKPML